MRIQLLSFPGCPNAVLARAALLRTLASLGVSEPVEEVDTTAPNTTESLRALGSPTILVDGVDVGGEPISLGTACRLYRSSEGQLQGFPRDELIATAVRTRQVLGSSAP